VDPSSIRLVCRALQADEPLCTDLPAAAAWYGGRASVLLPNTVDEFLSMHRIRPFGGLYLTPQTTGRALTDLVRDRTLREWFPLLEGRAPAGFPLTHAYPLYPPDQLFLTDRARWTDPAAR
jgi:hypothetical protein